MKAVWHLAIALLLALPLRAAAGEVVIVLSSDAKPYKEALSAIVERISKLGLTASQVMLKDATPEKLAQLGGGKPSAFVAVGSEAALTLHEAAPQAIPFCFCMVADPGGLGLTQGRPAQGVSIDIPIRAQFDLIAQSLPKARSIGMIYQAGTEKGRRQLKAAQDALPQGWRVEAVDLDMFESVSKAIDALLKRHVDVVWTVPDAAVYNSASVRVLLLAALRDKTPVFGYSKPVVRSGALLGVGIEPRMQGEQLAAMLGKLIDGSANANAAALEPPRFEFVINRIVAEKLSIDVPGDCVRRADEVIRGE